MRTALALIGVLTLVACGLGGCARSSPPAPVIDPTATQPRTDDSRWELVFSDEFDGPTLDLSKWVPQNAALVKNDESQFYTPDALSFRDGSLVITARRREMGGRAFTSGLIESRARFYQAYGRLEIRAQIPKGTGLWPAFWTLPESGRWPPEIDVMEAKGQFPRRIYTYHHWGPLEQRWSSGGAHELGPDYTAGYHVYRADWFPDRIEWSIDGAKVLTVYTNVPHEPFYILINLAVGGAWLGQPNETTPFPSEFKVDYVRWYRKIEPERTYLTLLHVDGGVRLSPERWVFAPGETATIEPVADPGFVFSGWEGDATGSERPLRLPMDRNRTVRATFVPDPSGTRLLSRGKPMTASNAEFEGLRAELAGDGILETRWSTLLKDAPQWLQVDLGEPRLIDDVRIRWHMAHARRYKVQLSDDGSAWRDAVVVSDGTGGVAVHRGIGQRARFARVLCEQVGGPFAYSIWEFDVFGR